MTRTITIEPVLNGFVCIVGCQRVVFNNIDALTTGLKDYYRNNEQVERQWIKDALNKTMDIVPTACDGEVTTAELQRNQREAFRQSTYQAVGQAHGLTNAESCPPPTAPYPDPVNATVRPR